MNTVGSTSLTAQACDTFPACVSTSFLVNVVANSPPTNPGLTNQVWSSATAHTYTIPTFTDPNGDAVTYSMSASCTGAMTFNAATPSLTAAVGATSGVYSCTLTADDGYTGGQTTATFTVTIGAGPVQPALTAQTDYVGKALTYAVPACTSPDGFTPVTQTAQNVGQTGITTPWLSFAAGSFTGTPTAAGVYNV